MSCSKALQFSNFHMTLHLFLLYKLVSSCTFFNFQTSLFLEINRHYLYQLLYTVVFTHFQQFKYYATWSNSFSAYMSFSAFNCTWLFNFFQHSTLHSNHFPHSAASFRIPSIVPSYSSAHFIFPSLP